MLDKELLLFPVMSTLALVAVIAGVGYPFYMSGELQNFVQALENNPQLQNDPRVLAGLFAFYFVNYFIMIYFNAALIGCALIRFAGGNPTVGDGFRLATRHLPQILLWSLVTASVGFLLEQLENRLKGLGRFFVGLLGAGWAVATYFAVPILVVDGVGPVQAVKRSVSAVRKTWGEALVGHIGLGALHVISILPAILLIFLGIQLADRDPVSGYAMIGLAVIWVMICVLVISTLSAILRAALYIYAVEGVTPENFDSQLIRNAFQPKA
ncbi:DUF6159 family protein [Roseibium aquae]|nr:DUF6159 family protein [Roseibium aquae]